MTATEANRQGAPGRDVGVGFDDMSCGYLNVWLLLWLRL
jgi:hypothetical protein